MHVWKFGCATMVLGLLLSLGSCGLFGAAIDRRLDERQIANLEFPDSEVESVFSVDIDERTRVRLDFEASVLPVERDFALADSSANIASSSLGLEYSVYDGEGNVLGRGAGRLNGTEIIPQSSQRATSPFGQQIDLRRATEPFDVDGAGKLTVRAQLARNDDAGRPRIDARILVSDRIATGSGRLALTGLASLFLGPLVVSLGVLVFVVGLVVQSQKRSAAPGRFGPE